MHLGPEIYVLQLFLLVYQAGMLAFHVLCVYALVTTQTERVTLACDGNALWVFILIRNLIMPLSLLLLLTLARCFLPPKNEESLPLYYWIPLLVSGGCFVCLCYLGCHYTLEAMGKPLCQEALVSASRFLDSPLLGVLGWFCVAFDALSTCFCFACMVLLMYVQ